MATPRLVSEDLAAKTVGVDVATFRHWVTTGHLPGPLPVCGLYDRKAIDLAIDRMSGLGSSGKENPLDAWREKKRAS